MTDKIQRPDLSPIRWTVGFVLSVLVILAGGYQYRSYEMSRIREERFRDLAVVVDLKTTEIRRWRKERLTDAQRSADSPLFRDAIDHWLRNPDAPRFQTPLLEQLKIDRGEDDYAEVLLLDPAGRILLSTLPKARPLELEERRAMERALQERQAVLSEIYRCSCGQIHMDAVAPIFDDQRRSMAVLALKINVAAYLYPLIQTWPTSSRSAETLLIRRDGEEVLFLNELRHRTNSALSLRSPMTRLDLPAVQAVLGKQGVWRGKDYRGVEVLADLRPIPGSAWFMVAKVDTDEVLAEARYRVRVALFFVALLILLAGALTAYAYRRRQTDLYRRLYRAERERTETQEEFRAALYSIGDAVITTDADGRVNRMNRVAEQLTGWTEASAGGKLLDEIFHIVNEDTHVTVENPVRRVLREGIVVGLANHTALLSRHGVQRPIADCGSPICDASGAIIGVALVFRDLTEERLAEGALRRSEERYRNLVENAPDAIFINRRDRVVYANNACLNLFRAESSDQILGKTPYELFHPDVHDLVRKRIHLLRETGKPVTSVEEKIVRFDGGIVDVEVSASPFLDEGMVQAIHVILRDITARKRAEEKALASRAKLEAALASMTDAVFISDSEGRFIDFNEAFATFHKFKDKETCLKTLAKYPEILDVFMTNGEPAPLEQWAVSRALRGETGVNVEYTLRRKDTGETWVGSYSFAPIRDKDGVIVGSVAAGRDITEQKRMEMALRESEARYRSLFENLIEGFAYCRMIYDAQGRPVDFIYLRVNPAFGRIAGVTPSEGQRVTEVFPGIKEAFPDLFEIYGRVALTGRPESFDLDFKPIHKWLRLSVYSPAKEHFVAVFFDITERKQAEKAIGDALEANRAIVDNFPVGIIAYQATGQCVAANAAAGKILGATTDQLKDQNFHQIESWKQAGLYEPARQALSTNQTISAQVEITTTFGVHLWLEVIFTPFRSGGELHLMTMFNNVTERKRAEEAIRAGEARLRLALDAAKAGAWEWNLITNENVWSDETWKLYGLESFHGKASYELWRETIHPDDRHKTEQAVREASQNGAELNAEWRVHKPGAGEARWLMSRGQPEFDLAGKIARYIGIVIDISERKHTEQVLRTLLEEKTALLKEIHHRVKNNLQIVDSILNLQIRRITNAAVVETLRDTQGRIRSMALLHETLYREDKAVCVNCATYLSHLCAHLDRSFGDHTKQIRLETRVEPVELGLDKAIPCGLIVNELVTNAFKHAFPGERAGQITVEFRLKPDNLLTLTVADNGVGLPPRFAPDSTNTLGMQLVRGLVNQIHGAMDIQRGPDVIFQIKFPPDNNKNQSS